MEKSWVDLGASNHAHSATPTPMPTPTPTPTAPAESHRVPQRPYAVNAPATTAFAVTYQAEPTQAPTEGAKAYTTGSVGGSFAGPSNGQPFVAQDKGPKYVVKTSGDVSYVEQKDGPAHASAQPSPDPFARAVSQPPPYTEASAKPPSYTEMTKGAPDHVQLNIPAAESETPCV